ncbi:tryptophan synthase subunit alpha [Rhodobacterales bacterium HTCC2150]|nr:tryptophan synthase subunit alpha [Rhodobacterales bacterium HTCC2150] [Rhodobacteraceae bacterium HTCC2150]
MIAITFVDVVNLYYQFLKGVAIEF